MSGPGDSAAGIAARRLAVEVLDEVLREDRPLDQSFDRLVKALKAPLEPRDTALARAIATNSLRRNGQINAILSGFLSKPLPAKSGTARAILLAGAAQMLFMRVPDHAAIDLCVSLAKFDQRARHFAGLINAVLRKVAKEGPGLLAAQDEVRLNVPGWLRERWTKAWGRETVREIGAALLAEAPLDLTPRDGDAKALAERLGGKALPTGSVRFEDHQGPIEALAGYEAGNWWVQDAAAALPVRLLGDVSGKAVLDLCAAPGGKTAQLVAAGATVTALDSSRTRLKRLQQNLSRLAMSAEVVCSRAQDFDALAEFDAVLVDAPCLATGTLRRHPDGLVTKHKAQLKPLQSLQRQILAHAVTLVKPGGVLVYCTCSLEPEEGEDQARWIADSGLPVTIEIIRADEIAGQQHLINPDGFLRTLPHHEIGDALTIDGFFAMRIRKL